MMTPVWNSEIAEKTRSAKFVCELWSSISCLITFLASALGTAFLFVDGISLGPSRVTNARVADRGSLRRAVAGSGAGLEFWRVQSRPEAQE